MLQPFTCRLIVVIHGRRVITKRECFTGSAEIFQVCVGLLAHPWNFLRTICLETRGPLQAIGLQRGCFAQLGAASVFARCLYGENLHWFCSIKVGQSTCARFYIIYCLHLDRTEFKTSDLLFSSRMLLLNCFSEKLVHQRFTFEPVKGTQTYAARQRRRYEQTAK